MAIDNRIKEYISKYPQNAKQIVAWVDFFLGFKIHSTIRCKDCEGLEIHQSQLDYISSAFFGEYSSAVVMAARSAGKSYAASILCLLDCWFKPGIKIAIAAYQRNQSDYIYVYCRDFIDRFETRIGEKVAHIGKNEIEFKNGSIIQFFSGGKSQAGIKGAHPTVLIVDEGDLFSQDQFDGIANALESNSKYSTRFDVLSTNYTVSGEGIILKQIEKYEEFNSTRSEALRPKRIFRICLMDVLAHCEEKFECYNEKTKRHCYLWKYCKGKCKEEGGGFYAIDRAIDAAVSSSLQVFESQMLLLRPTSQHAYFHTFSQAENVLEVEREWDSSLQTYWGFDFGGSRCEHAAVLMQKDENGIYWVIDEFSGMGNLESMLGSIRLRYEEAIKKGTCFYDPKGNDRHNTTAGTSYAATLRKAGFTTKTKQLGRRESFEVLYAQITPAAGPTKLRINKRCTKLIAQIQAAEYEVFKGHPTPEPSNKIVPDDHLDCCRYVVGWTNGKNLNRKTIPWFKV